MAGDPQSVSQQRQRYQFIPRTLIFLRYQNDILLLKGAPNKRLYANLYNGIGGHVERNEQIPESARREAAEEVGITEIDALQLCAVISIDSTEYTGVLLFVFVGTVLTHAAHASDEGIPEWFNQLNLPYDRMPEDLAIVLPRILSVQENEPPLFIHYTYNSSGTLSIRFAEA